MSTSSSQTSQIYTPSRRFTITLVDEAALQPIHQGIKTNLKVKNKRDR